VFDVENHTVAVTYRIVQGREVTIREILINGNTHTRDRVVRREISIFPGQRADLKEIERSLGLITATNFFSDSYNRMQHRDPTYRFVATPDNPGQVDLEYVLEEGRVIDVNVAGGVGSDNGAFAQVALTMRNFDASDAPDSWFGSFGEVWRKEALHGSGQLLELYATPGTVVSEYRVRFMEPDLFGWHLRPIMLDVDFSKRLRLYRTHDEQRSQLRLRLGRRLNFETRAWAGFVLQDVEVSDLDPDGVPLELYDQYDRGLTRLAGVSFDLSSRRVDNQLIPHDGYTLALGSVLYSRQLGSEFDITTAELRGDWYTPTWTTDDGTQPVLHLEFNIAAQQPYDETPRVPYSERYFLGGTNSLRGFQFRGVGPVDPLSREPRGGETQLFGTFEWFYPLHATTQPGTYRKLEVLRGGLFFDYGLLDPESWSLDFDELRTSAGFTLGLTYPIPITLNFGYPIRQFDGDNRQTFSFTMGTR
jgi:outer membrane protein insertion porin family